MKPQVGMLPKDFTFWNTNTSQMVIINEEDFPRQEILRELGIDYSALRPGFGNADPKEAKERLAVMKFIYDHPDFIGLVKKLKDAPGVPKNQDEFMNYYDPNILHNPFWQAYHELMSFLTGQNPDTLPPRLQEFYQALKSYQGIEDDEKQMAKIIGELLESTAIFEGMVFIDLSCLGAIDQKDPEAKMKYYLDVHDIKFGHLHGNRTFSFALSEARQKRYPRFNGWGWLLDWNIGELMRKVIDYQNRIARQQAYKTMVFDHSSEILEDLKQAIPERLQKCKQALPVLDGKRFGLLVYFAYGKSLHFNDNGLSIQIYDIYVHNEAHTSLGFEFASFEGYSDARQKLIYKARKEFQVSLNKSLDASQNAKLRSLLEQADEHAAKKLFGTRTLVPSPNTNQVHKWGALENLYNSSDLIGIYKAILALHVFGRKHATTLIGMHDLLENICIRAEKLKSTICFPEILDSDVNEVSFRCLYPLHFGRALEGKKIIPINGLPSINGNMIGLTGRHAGGKTVTEHTITGNVFVAQSGLPVIGKEFKMSPKTHLGMVFIEGISGRSVAQVLMQKTEKIFRAIHRVNGKHVLLVFDELGSATQEQPGLDLSLDILNTLYLKKVSLIFSTQILNVAEEATRLFGAKCFKVDREHRISEGIAGGDLESLAKEVGLRKWVKKRNVTETTR